MPSQAIKPTSLGMTGMRNNDTWTDGLPICKLSGVGMSANQMYREDGTPCSEHEYEDRSIHFCLDRENHTYLYGVFDGHDGAKAAYFASQRMPAELSFEQLTGKNNRRRDGMSQFEAAQKFPETFSRLQALDQEIRGGTTAVVALIHGKTLYVGNVGDSRALLCKKDRSGVLKVKQLTSDHTTSSHDELQRLEYLNLSANKIRGAKLGNHELTRCIGNYFMKGGYSEFDILSSATAEPVIAEPYITFMPIDESCSFLLLMSDGLYNSYKEATGSEQVNKEIAQMVVEQFVEQPTLTSIAQTVVDKVVRLHHDNYLTKQRNVTTRDDITLIIRNFNFPLRSALTPSAVSGGSSPRPPIHHRPHLRTAVRTPDLSSSSSSEDITLCKEPDSLPSLPPVRLLPGIRGHKVDMTEGVSNSVDDNCLVHHTDTNTTSTESSDLQNPSLTQFSLDEDGRIHPYVSFDQYYQAIEEARIAGLISESQLYQYK
ncbi:Mitogen-activated protein kinase kinase kinase 7-interacting protein 1 [Penaeus vannamei]|uniref:Mitogen-activated protein kinase kinase kinase 7-interacting protein 1 n=1 Tax=Penaeus vannamei TaxID=6689 RepID=A0A423TBA9_PENVA|nr:Mitogen-activated protein kinase kinase kinase 7-interacting protein 1 [Penaeus vannamei]